MRAAALRFFAAAGVRRLGVFAAAGLGAPQESALRDAVLRATLHPGWKEALQRNSWQPSWQAGDEFAASLEDDIHGADQYGR